jgi:hypothetical protein
MPKRAKQRTITLHLRLPVELHKQISEFADSNSPRDSINRAVVGILQEYFAEPDTELAELQTRVAELERLLSERRLAEADKTK